jgi:hypothetical protein
MTVDLPEVPAGISGASGGRRCDPAHPTGVIYRSAVYMIPDESSPVERAAVEKAAEAWAHRPYQQDGKGDAGGR